jgi:HAD superfamily hydrolase (TIGR01549 family)
LKNELQKNIIESDAYVFDFLHTLVDVNKDRSEWWKTIKEMGFDCNKDLQVIWETNAFDGSETPSLISSPTYDEWKSQNIYSLVQMSGVPNSLLDDITKKLLEIDKIWNVESTSGSIELLAFLKKQGKKVGVCSNWDYSLNNYLLQTKLPSFDATVTSAEVGARKPHRIPFITICDKLCVSPTKATIIGDSWTADIIGALRVGLNPIWINKNKFVNPLPKLVMDFPNLEDLLIWFKGELEYK